MHSGFFRRVEEEELIESLGRRVWLEGFDLRVLHLILYRSRQSPSLTSPLVLASLQTSVDLAAVLKLEDMARTVDHVSARRYQSSRLACESEKQPNNLNTGLGNVDCLISTFKSLVLLFKGYNNVVLIQLFGKLTTFIYKLVNAVNKNVKCMSRFGVQYILGLSEQKYQWHYCYYYSFF